MLDLFPTIKLHKLISNLMDPCIKECLYDVSIKKSNLRLNSSLKMKGIGARGRGRGCGGGRGLAFKNLAIVK
jgi:hypothetical protein